jgi:hypothetical protein
MVEVFDPGFSMEQGLCNGDVLAHQFGTDHEKN